MNLYGIICILYLYIQIGDAVYQGDEIFLIDAVNQGNTDIVNWLVGQKAFLDVQDEKGVTPLMQATVSNVNQIKIINILLEAGADTDIRDNQGKTALHHAIGNGFKDAVKLIADKTKNIGIADANGRNGLHFAVMSDNEEMISYLANRGIDLYAKDSLGFTAMHIAAMHGRTSILKMFKEKGIDLNLATANHTTALILASLFERVDTAKLILQHGVNIDHTDINRWSALHAAAYSGNSEIVQLLVDNHATLNLRNTDGRTPLYLATLEGHTAVAKYLTEKGANILITDNYNNNILHAAARSGNLELFEFFSKKHIPINIANFNGSTPLITAAEMNNKEIIQYLVKIGADKTDFETIGQPYLYSIVTTNNTDILADVRKNEMVSFNDIKDSHGSTLLHHAAKYSNSQMINYILHAMAKDYLKKRNPSIYDDKTVEAKLKSCLPCYKTTLDIRDNDGKTPLHRAVEADNTEAIDVFIKQGASQGILDNRGLTAFHLAAVLGRENILNTLALHTPDVNAIDGAGKTALFLAAEAGNIQVMTYLIDIGADMSVHGPKKQNLFHAAFAEGHKQIVEELLTYPEYAHNINQKDQDGKTPAWYADFNGFQDIVTAFITNGTRLDGFSMCEAVENKTLDIVKYLHSRNNNLDGYDCYGNGTNLFHIAVFKGQVGMIQQLISLYPHMINNIDDKNRSPTWYAVKQHKWDMVAQLETAKGKVVPNITIVTAVDEEDIDTVKYLLQKGADVDSRTKDSAPIIFRAALLGNLEIVKLLVENGADIEARYLGEFTTALHIASNRANCDVVEFLLKKGAKVNPLSKHGKTPLDLTRLSCKPILLKYGAKESDDSSLEKILLLSKILKDIKDMEDTSDSE